MATCILIYYSLLYILLRTIHISFFACKLSKYEKFVLMRHESSAPDTYEDTIRAVGDPNKTVTDNTHILTGVRWTTINRR